MKKIFTLIFTLNLLNSFAQPANSPIAPPTRNATDYISLYSQSYSNIDSTDFFPGWGQSTQIQEFYVGSDTMIQYSNFNYQGWQLKKITDVSNMTKLHIDLWSSNCTEFKVFLINTAVVPAIEQEINLTPVLNSWNSFDIDLSLYTNIALHNIGQLKFVSTPFGGTPGPTIYLDNVYFYKNANVPTISNFIIPSKNVGNSPFAINAPTSNSSGTFSYTSTNTSVATVSGNTITVVGVGTTTIKATQAAAGGFTTGTISTSFTVNTGLATAPTTPAPTPTKAQANVLSLFSDVYYYKPINTFSAAWDQADVSNFLIGTDSVKRYTNLAFCGIEFLGSNRVNVTNADFFHIDIWTPNATNFKIKLVDFGANGVFGGGDDREHEYTVTPNPTLSNWVSLDIPMSAFTNLTTRANLSQLILSSSGSTVYVDNIYFWSNTAVLPVELKSFTANKKENNVTLDWSVANEINFSGYQIEKSADGRNFESIGMINAMNINNYSFTDFHFKNTSYYRLKMIDKNGKFTYSNIIFLENKKSSLISVYPNPAKGSVMINNLSENSKISIVNYLGQTVLQKSNLNSSIINLDISSLSTGNYAIIVNDLNERKSLKLTVIK